MPEGALPEGALPEGALPEGALPEGALPEGELSEKKFPDVEEALLREEPEVEEWEDLSDELMASDTIPEEEDTPQQAEDISAEEDILPEEDDTSAKEDILPEEDDTSAEEDVLPEEDDTSAEEDILPEEDDISAEEDVPQGDDDSSIDYGLLGSDGTVPHRSSPAPETVDYPLNPQAQIGMFDFLSGMVDMLPPELVQKAKQDGMLDRIQRLMNNLNKTELFPASSPPPASVDVSMGKFMQGLSFAKDLSRAVSDDEAEQLRTRMRKIRDRLRDISRQVNT